MRRVRRVLDRNFIRRFPIMSCEKKKKRKKHQNEFNFHYL